MTKNLFVISKIADNVGTMNKLPSRDTNNSWDWEIENFMKNMKKKLYI